MSDFETHARGTYAEIKQSRELANAIQQLIDQYGEGIIPHSILVPYKKLYQLYQIQIASEYE
jgi:hypothetical protein